MKTIPTLFLTATAALLPLSASTPPPTAPASAAAQETEEEEIPSGPTLEEIGQIVQAICAHPQAKKLMQHPNACWMLLSLAGCCDNSNNFEEAAPMLALMLRHGADPLMRFPDVPRVCSLADIIHNNPRLEQYLREQGIEIPYRAYMLRREHLLEDIHALPIPAHPPIETLLAVYDDMAAQLMPAPGDTMMQRSARRRVLELMHQADATRTAEFVMRQPQWEETECWQYYPRRFDPVLLDAISYAEKLILQPDWIVATAEALHTRSCTRAAHELVALLGRDTSPAAAAHVEKLLDDTRPAFSAAAWGARLRQAGMPEDDIYVLPRLFTKKTEAYKRACLLKEAFFALNSSTYSESGFRDFCRHSGHPKPAELDELCRTLTEYGAEEVVPYVRELDSLLRVENPTPAQATRLAELESPTLAEPASFAAEIAIAKFIWQHCESLKRTAHP